LDILNPREPQSLNPVIGADGRVATAIPFQADHFDAEFQQHLSPQRFETFTPSTLGDVSQLQEGDAGSVFGQAFGEGIAGAGWYDNLSPEERERMTISAANYSDSHGVFAFGASLAGGLISDAPIDLALSLTGVGVLKALNHVVKAGKGAKYIAPVVKARDALQKIENAYTGVGGTVGSRFATRQMTEFATGMTAAAISDELQRSAGDKLITADETLERMLMEGAAGMVFGEALRTVGKSASFLKRKINEDLPDGQKIENDELVERLLDKEEGKSGDEVIAEAEDAIRKMDEGGILSTSSILNESNIESEVPVKAGDGKRLFNVDKDGAVNVDPSFRGTVKDVVEELSDGGNSVGKKGSSKIITQLFERLKEVSGKIEGRTIFDDLLDLPVTFMTKAEMRKKRNVGGFFHHEHEMSGSRVVRQLKVDGQKGSKLKVREGAGPDRMAHVIAHELTHAATVLELNARVGDLKATLPPHVADSFDYGISDPAVAKKVFDDSGMDKSDPLYILNEVFLKTKNEKFVKELGFEDDQYGFLNIKEFVAEAFSNERFQRMLENVKFDEGSSLPTTLWDKIVDALSKVFGIKDKTALSETIKATDAIATEGIQRGVVDPNARKNKRKAPEKAKKAKKPKKPEPPADKKTPAQQAAFDRAEAEAEVINGLATDKESGLASGLGAIGNSKFLKFMRGSINSLLTTDNISVFNLFDMMGGAGKHMKQKMVDAAELTAKINNLMQPHVARAEELVKTHRKMLRAKTEVELEVADTFLPKGSGKDASGQTGISGNQTKITMTGNQRTELYMKMMDGLRKNGADDDKGFKHSSSKDLYKEDGGVEIDGKTYVFTKDQVKAIQKDPSILVGKAELELADAIWSGYRSIVPLANEIGVKITGTKIAAEDNWYYSPKHLIQSAEEVEVFDILLAKMTKKDPLAVARNLNERVQTGGLTHSLTDSLGSLKAYRFTMSNTLGHADLNIQFEKLMKNHGKTIKEVYGESWEDTLSKNKAVFRGDTKELGSMAMVQLGQLLSLRAQAILGYNPSVALKQLGSVWSAVATGKINSTTGIQLTKEAMTMMGNKTKRLATVDEMVAHSEFYKQRNDSGNINIELNDLAESLTGDTNLTDIPKDVLRKSKIGETLLNKAGEVDQFRLKHLGDSMSWIRKLDEAAMASIWNAVKKEKFGADGPKTKEDWDLVNSTFTDIAMESQPTYNMGSRTFNQMRKGLAAKALTQFSTQTAKNWGLAYKHTLEFANSPRGAGDKAKMIQGLAPLLIQNAYIAAVTVGVGGATSGLRELLGGDENRRTRMEKAFPNTFARLLVENINGVTGQVAGVGNFTKAISSGIMGVPVYDQTIPVVQEFMQFNQAFSDRSLSRMLKAILTLSGTPISIPRTLGL